MESFIIFLVMFSTVIVPSLAIGAVVFGIPIALLVMVARGNKLTTKVVLIACAAIVGIPIITEVISVVALLVLFQLFGQPA